MRKHKNSLFPITSSSLISPHINTHTQKCALSISQWGFLKMNSRFFFTRHFFPLKIMNHGWIWCLLLSFLMKNIIHSRKTSLNWLSREGRDFFSTRCCCSKKNLINAKNRRREKNQQQSIMKKWLN